MFDGHPGQERVHGKPGIGKGERKQVLIDVELEGLFQLFAGNTAPVQVEYTRSHRQDGQADKNDHGGSSPGPTPGGHHSHFVVIGAVVQQADGCNLSLKLELP